MCRRVARLGPSSRRSPVAGRIVPVSGTLHYDYLRESPSAPKFPVPEVGQTSSEEIR